MFPCQSFFNRQTASNIAHKFLQGALIAAIFRKIQDMAQVASEVYYGLAAGQDGRAGGNSGKICYCALPGETGASRQARGLNLIIEMLSQGTIKFDSGMTMKRPSRNSLLITLLLLICTLAACGPGNSVRLLPPPPLAASSLPPPNAPSVSVVNFSDDRPDQYAIGTRRDGSAFTTGGDVAQWIGRSLADELARRGFRVTFAMDANQARNSNPDYLVTGKVDQVWIRESSALEMSAQMRVNCTLASRKGKLWTETCNSSQSRGTLPSSSAADKLLLDTLDDLLRPIAQKILQTVEGG